MSLQANTTSEVQDTVTAVLEWYAKNHRKLPWRMPPKQLADPYHVWLSEVMLQQTTVPAVIPYFEKFLEMWPTLTDLANASEESVMQAWAGLGYYSRARNLHKAAQTMLQDHDGKVPHDPKDILALSGVGAYTAAAIGAIAYGRPEIPLDANLERVFARFFACDTPMPSAKPILKAAAQPLFDVANAESGDLAQALMDIGSDICTPKAVYCGTCPLNPACLSARAGGGAGAEMALKRPVLLPKPLKPTRRGVACVVKRIGSDDAENILLYRRPPSGLLGGMWGFPSDIWVEVKPDDAPMGSENLIEQSLSVLQNLSPLRQSFSKIQPLKVLPKPVRHTFTHFHLILDVVIWQAEVLEAFPTSDTLCWVAAKNVPSFGLPTLMQKVWNMVRDGV